MRLNVFSSAVKEIVLTGVASLFLFSLLAAQGAEAEDLQIRLPETKSIQLIETPSKTALKNAEALVKALEQDVIKSKILLTVIDAQFGAEEISADELFAATVKFYEVQDALQRAQLDLTIVKNRVNDPVEMTFARTQ
jgi:hypothetical protein